MLIAAIAAVFYGQAVQAATVMRPSTMQDFKSQVASGKVAIFFGTMSCPHCRAFLPKFSEVAAGNNNVKFVFAELGSKELADLSYQYKVNNPTLVVLNNGTEIKRIPSTGLNKQTLQSAIQ